MSLELAKNLKLPDEAVTQTFAILAKRGVGKTYTASVMVEEMLKNKLHVVVVDPIGVWWGLRTSASGKQAGLSIIVAGGEHGDVPLESTSGELIANLIVDRGLSLVIDLSLMRKGEQKRFMIDFAETLYRNNRAALHLVLDEADEFAPQRPMGDDARMLGAIEDIVRRGRARGIGVTLITQRPAVLNKNVLTQIEVLIAMRLTSPQDRQALNEWVKYHADTDRSTEMITELPMLPIGTAWFWSPGWLDMFKKVAIRKRETFDSSSTPKVGQAIVKAGKVAPVDIDELKEQLAATIEKVEGADPKLLRRRIVELERELAKKKPEVQVKEIEVPVITDRQIQNLTNAALAMQNTSEVIIAAIEKSNHKHIPPPGYPPLKPSFAKPNANKIPEAESPPPLPQMQISDDNGEVKIKGGARRILEVLGSRNPMRFTRSQLATLSKLSPRSGTYGTYLSLLRSNGFIDQENDQIFLTASGLAYLGDVPLQPQTTDEVINMWRSNLKGGARRMFDVLVGYYPAAISREELGQGAEISPTSGTFGTYISMLAGNGLIERSSEGIKASDTLFAGGA